jgi:hypothetical protein
MNPLFRIGLIALLVAFGLWIYKDQGNAIPVFPSLDTYLAIGGAACIVLFLLLFVLTTVSGKTYKVVHKNRCPRCGRRVPKGEIYCNFHRQEVQSEFLSGLSDNHSLDRFKTPEE